MTAIWGGSARSARLGCCGRSAPRAARSARCDRGSASTPDSQPDAARARMRRAGRGRAEPSRRPDPHSAADAHRARRARPARRRSDELAESILAPLDARPTRRAGRRDADGQAPAHRVDGRAPGRRSGSGRRATLPASLLRRARPPLRAPVRPAAGTPRPSRTSSPAGRLVPGRLPARRAGRVWRRQAPPRRAVRDQADVGGGIGARAGDRPPHARALETARRAGAATARLDTNRTLVEAIAMYRSAGYVEVPRVQRRAVRPSLVREAARLAAPAAKPQPGDRHGTDASRAQPLGQQVAKLGGVAHGVVAVAVVHQQMRLPRLRDVLGDRRRQLLELLV